MELNNGIKKTFGALTVDHVKPSQYKKNVSQAQIRQTVTTEYPSQRAGNSKSGSLFEIEEFAFAPGQAFNSTRVTWVDVPEGTTVEKVVEKLAGLPNACIQRVISNNVLDCLTAEQKSAIDRGIRTLDEYKDSLLVRGEGGVALPGAPQYRQNFFQVGQKADEDFRTLPAKAVAAGANIEDKMLAN